MKTKIGELEKGTSFIRKGIWYKKVHDKWSGRSTQDDGGCAGLSQFGVFTFFENNAEVEITNESKEVFVRDRTSK